MKSNLTENNFESIDKGKDITKFKKRMLQIKDSIITTIYANKIFRKGVPAH